MFAYRFLKSHIVRKTHRIGCLIGILTLIPLMGLQASDNEAVTQSGSLTLHWAFVPVARPELPLPDLQSNSTAQNPIDLFVDDMRQQHSLGPVGQADVRTLARRLYFDLLGLPPSQQQMQTAIDSLTPWDDNTWAQLIDALLNSPRYGERWGRHWLDVAHYADTAGDNADYPVPEARLYRDYVIDAFNADMPYDQFVREQLAGDLIADDLIAADGPSGRYAEQIVATGFLAISRRYATGPYEFWHLTLEDTIDTVGQSFMGLTLRCARCHDHKFDPITQQDYYALYGIFESTEFPWPGGEEFHSKKLPRQKFTPLLLPAEAETLLQAHRNAAQVVKAHMEDMERVDPLAVSIEQYNARLKSLRDQSASEIEIQNIQRERDAARKQLDTKKAALQIPFDHAVRIGYPQEVPSAYAVHDGVPRSAVLQIDGEPSQPGSIVPRGVPEFLAPHGQPEIPNDESGRRQLAEWLTRPDHPLTARVIVNRIWHHHFGRGLVATPSNFGIRGAVPSNPSLLDWLAAEFVEQGWSIKSLHRMILTSETWKLGSSNDEQNAAHDPANEFLWRHNRRRLDAESIRDSLLMVSGRLNLDRPGSHPFTPIPSWTYTQHNQFREFFPSVHRSVYLMTPRLQRHPFLALFDAPDTNTTNGSRTSAIVPAQALYLMNSGEIKSEAEAFARRILALPPESRIDDAWAIALQRSPTPGESDRSAEFLNTYTQKTDEVSAWTALGRSLLTSHEFFYVD